MALGQGPQREAGGSQQWASCWPGVQIKEWRSPTKAEEVSVPRPTAPPGPCPGSSARPRKTLLGKEAEAPPRTPGGGHRGPPCHLPDTSPPPFFYSPQGWTHDCLSQANGANSGVLLAAPSSSWGVSQRTRDEPGAAGRDFRETLLTENEANPGKRQMERSNFWIQL